MSGRVKPSKSRQRFPKRRICWPLNADACARRAGRAQGKAFGLTVVIVLVGDQTIDQCELVEKIFCAPRSRNPGQKLATSESLSLCPGRSPHCYQDEHGPRSTRARSNARSPVSNFTTRDSCSGCTRMDRDSCPGCNRRRTIHRLPYRSWRADKQFRRGYASAYRSATSNPRSRQR
jgi:hypothetical protein